jgi:hypothetical protein
VVLLRQHSCSAQGTLKSQSQSKQASKQTWRRRGPEGFNPSGHLPLPKIHRGTRGANATGGRRRTRGKRVVDTLQGGD